MSKIGTAHIEIKPVLNHEALDALCDQIETAVREAVQRGTAVQLPNGNRVVNLARPVHRLDEK